MMRRFLSLAAGLFLALSLTVGVSSAATADGEECAEPGDVPFVIEFGTLDGEDRILCAKDAEEKTAMDALEGLGLPIEKTTGSMPMLCRIDGEPTTAQEKCGDALNADGYWAFLLAEEDKPWDYASVGLDDQKLSDGTYVALVYHLMADGENVPVSVEANAETRDDATAPSETGTDKKEDSSPVLSTTAMVIGAAVVVAIVLLLVMVIRRRGRA